MSRLRELLPLYSRLLAYAKPYRARLAGGIVFSILYGATNAAFLFIVRKVWAGVIESTDGRLGWWEIIAVALLLPLVMAVRGAFDFIGNYSLNWVGLRVVTDLRVRIFEHLQSLSLDFFSESRSGDLISRLTNDVVLVQRSVTNVVEDVIKQPFSLLAVLGYLLYSDWKMTLTSLVLFPVCVVPIMLFGRRTRLASRATQQHQASVVSVLHEAIAGLRVIKAFSAEARETQDFRDLCRKVFGQQMRVVRSGALLRPIIELLAAAGVALVFVYAYRQRMPGSQLVSMAFGLYMVYEPVKKLSRVHLTMQETLSAAERIFQLLDTPSSVVEAPTAKALPCLQRSVRFEHVSFRYRQSLPPPAQLNGAVLDGIDLEIPVGACFALVGRSGSGKTTLLNLIPRFYDPTEGAVTIDGVNLREVSFRSLREQIGVVTQETFLFNDTVANNIAYGKPGATQEEVLSAAQRAHADEFISQMPQRYDTIVGEAGVKLSGGQRQRLAIARAILKNPPILLLDEATSALDTESERVVQAALDELMWGSATARRLTMLVIAHRLSTVQHADRIIVLEQGRIVEQGTHAELLARGQAYKRLHDLQFGGESES